MTRREFRQDAEHTTGASDGRQVLKICGGDIELGNFVLGNTSDTDTCAEASQNLLHEIDGVTADTGIAHAQDRGRRFLPGNGGCVYIDLNHLELCLPEVTNARDHVAAWHAMLRIARQAQVQANLRKASDRQIEVLVNNSDGLGHSYGSHLDLLVTHRAWQNIFRRKLQYLLYLATYQVSSIIFTGQGKVGSENGRPRVDYQLSQRADYFETLTGSQTTFNRPLVNSRDEALCGRRGTTWAGGPPDGEGLARLHCIFYDNTLGHVSSYLKVGVMQLILAMIEAEQVNLDLTLEDPVAAVRRWSHDPALRTCEALIGGGRVTALQLQYRFLEEATRFAGRGGFTDVVPGWQDILARWESTLKLLDEGDLAKQARCLDWALKELVITRTLDRHPQLNWASPEIKHLDQIFGSLDPDVGLYWAYERGGFTDRIVTDREITRFVDAPPDDTRAWTRAMLLRRVKSWDIERMDWDTIRIRQREPGLGTVYRQLEMADPAGLTREQTEAVFRATETAGQALDELGAVEVQPPPPVSQPSWGHGWGATPSLPAASVNGYAAGATWTNRDRNNQTR